LIVDTVMQFMSRFLFVPVFLLIHAFAEAQFTYSIDQSIHVEIDGKKLAMPWAGGLNAAQINTMDLNGDNKQDLVVFDRTANKVVTFLNQNNQYVYSPDYESSFPVEVDQWMLLRDFNCDGKKDIFTGDPFGMVAFINTTQPGKQISWRPFNPDLSNKPRPILTLGFSGNISVKINGGDIPAIDDVDGDGDLDILNFYFVGQGVEWHKNVSARCDTIQLERITREWGDFQECNCGKVSFDGGITCINPGGRTQHTVGRSLLSIDFDNDGAPELFFSEESCTNLYLLNNEGTAGNAAMTSFSTFPSTGPLSMPFFPAPYSEDVDFDGVPDLIVSPNLGSRTAADAPFLVDFQKSLYLFKNTGTKQLPQFNFSKPNFLQGEMIDVGDNSVPAFFDFDGDGDQDMFVSNYTKTSLSSTVYQFENIGSAQAPSFKLINEDFFSLSILNQYNFKIQFADMNGDAKIDLAFSASAKRTGLTEIYFLANSANDKFVINDPVLKETNFLIAFSENWTIVDVDQDGLNDILVGNDTGGMEYWKNEGPTTAYKYTLVSSSFLGIENSTDRQNLAMTAADLDADGLADLVVGDQRGKLSIFGDFRAQNSNLAGAESIIFNEQTKKYESRNLGGRAWPATANLFNSNSPSIIVGNTLGGLIILKNDGGKELPTQPQITIYPNPYTFSEASPLKIRADRNVTVQFYNLLGQRISNSYFIPANQDYPINVSPLAAGIYVAQFAWKGKTYGKRFIVSN
jgi:FG-GAP-like repeat/Secretion system C-terminal sorting domain